MTAPGCRLFTRRGHDWTERFPVIAAAAAALRAKSFTIDGEAVIAGPDGVAAFDELHSRRRLGAGVFSGRGLVVAAAKT